MRYPPRRIICLTEETVETLYLLGEDHRIVGVSGYAVRPPQVRRQKPRVSAFISADLPKILALDPDLVLTFSDLRPITCRSRSLLPGHWHIGTFTIPVSLLTYRRNTPKLLWFLQSEGAS